jgi:hypothetical protein
LHRANASLFAMLSSQASNKKNPACIAQAGQAHRKEGFRHRHGHRHPPASELCPRRAGVNGVAPDVGSSLLTRAWGVSEIGAKNFSLARPETLWFADGAGSFTIVSDDTPGAVT